MRARYIRISVVIAGESVRVVVGFVAGKYWHGQLRRNAISRLLILMGCNSGILGSSAASQLLPVIRVRLCLQTIFHIVTLNCIVAAESNCNRIYYPLISKLTERLGRTGSREVRTANMCWKLVSRANGSRHDPLRAKKVSSYGQVCRRTEIIYDNYIERMSALISDVLKGPHASRSSNKRIGTSVRIGTLGV